MVLSERLSLLRKEKGLTQQEISKRLKMARTTYSGYENGSREPDNETLDKLAEFHGESVDFLLGRTNIRGNSSHELHNITKFQKDSTEYVIRELVDKYNLDLTDPNKRATLEKMIRIVAED